MFKSRIYRHDNEQVVLLLTVLLVLAVIILTSTVTFCLSGVLIIVMFILSAILIRSHHQSLMKAAMRVTPARTPDLSGLVETCGRKLQPGPVEVYLVNQDQINAYTFGIDSPKVLVLYTPLLKVMNAGELNFIIGHEMGHVALGHTWLNTIVGGLAGIPAPFGAAVLLFAAFRWWNRMCEFSADRAGLLACGDLNTAVSALVKLVAPEVRSQGEFDRALALIDAQDDSVTNRLGELFQSHPMLIRRINKLREYAATAEYRRLQAGVNGNVGMDFHEAGMTNGPSPGPVKPAQEKEPLPPEERWPWLKK
jgi:Zn-dependent protease with chaperone function